MHVRTNFLSMVAFLVASMTEGHMIMNHPRPFSQDLNNSPLNGDGSDFPCKQRGSSTYAMTDGLLESNVYPIGSNTTLSFTGGVTHGGGSCQISLTTDLEPTKDSKWFVIYSIEGGCPSSYDGSLSQHPNDTSATVFQFKIPQIQVGRYTLAWTWFNRIGNREMYMNCAPIEIISGSNGKRDGNTLESSNEHPEMFVANINGCETKENVEIRFPNPGKFVQYAGKPSYLQPAGEPACTGGMGPTETVVRSAAAPTVTTTQIGTPGGSSKTTTVTGNERTDSAGESPQLPATTTTTGTATQATAHSGDSSENGSSGTSPSSSALTGACTPEGQWNCIGGTSFQRCASGIWSVAESVAEGTFCSPGQSASLQIASGREHVAGIHRRRVSHGHRARP